MCINENDRPIASTGGGNERGSVGGLSKTTATAITTAVITPTAVIATTAADTLTAPSSSSSAGTVTTTHDHNERHDGSPNKGSHINSLSAGVGNGKVTGQGVVGLTVGSLGGSVPVSTVGGVDTGIGTGVGLGARPTVGVAVDTGGIGGILTPTVRSNIASRSKEALQRHQERMEKRRLEKLHQQYQQLPNEQTH